jgi:hypothetical protein
MNIRRAISIQAWYPEIILGLRTLARTTTFIITVKIFILSNSKIKMKKNQY